jgi:hypothetical protein
MPDKILILSGNERIFRSVHGFVEISEENLRGGE